MLTKTVSIIIILAFILTAPAPFRDAENDTPSLEWYDNWSLDSNRNKIDDRLEKEMGNNDFTGTYSVFVDYTRETDSNDVRRLLQLGLEINYAAKYMPTIAAQEASYRNIVYLSQLDEVAMVELDSPIERFLDISASSVKARESGTYSPDTAWDTGYTGRDIVIAILDTGVDDSHESLDGKFVAGVDVSNPGFDVNGNPDDGNGHGSHCAGIAMGDGGATDENGDGEPDYQGTAPDALLVDVKIGTDLGGNLGNNIIRGIEWCRENKDEHNIRVLSISFGSTSGSDGQDATSRAANEAVLEDGLILVTAAGNDGPDNNGLPPPAAADEVITVGAVSDKETIARGDDSIAGYSNRGPREDDGDDDQLDEFKPEVCAPGTDIMSVQYSEIGQGNANIEGQYSEKTGTSMACPHVSGIVALMLEAEPSLTPAQVKDYLKKTAERRGEPYDSSVDEDYSKAYGWGIVDAYKAVKAALGEVPDEEEGNLSVSIKSPENGEKVSGKVTFRGTASAKGNLTVEKVELEIAGKRKTASGTDNWEYTWDSTKLNNGNYTIDVFATNRNGTENATASVDISINNTGVKKNDENDEDKSITELGFEDLKELDETTAPVYAGIAVACAVVVLGIVLRRRKKSSEFPEDDEEEDDISEDREDSWD